MALIDLKEIPEAHVSSGYQDRFELFCQEFFKYMNLKIVSSPDRGADGGKDLICEEERIGPLGKSKIRWIVSCKHKAHSGNSVTIQDEQDITDRINQHGANGFIGFYSTIVQSSLNKKLKSIEKNYEVKIYNSEDIEREVLNNENCEEILSRFFPKSYIKYKNMSYNSNYNILRREPEILKINYKKGIIIKSNSFIRGIYKVNEYIVRVLDYILSNIECEGDLDRENFINIKDFRMLYDYKGGDLYDQVYNAVNELKNIKIHLNDSKYIRIFKHIYGANGIVEYIFSDEFVELNYKGKDLNYFELDKVIKLRSFRAKRLHEILSTYKFNKYRVTNEELQKILQVPYNVYSDIKRHVVDVSIRDINEIYDMQIEYSPIQKGSKYIGFEFNIN